MQLVHVELGTSIRGSILVFEVVVFVGDTVGAVRKVRGADALTRLAARLYLTTDSHRVKRLADTDRLWLKRIRIPILKVINKLFLAGVDIILQADELLLQALQLTEVVSVVSFHVFDFLEHHELLLINDIFGLHFFIFESIEAHLVAKSLALHLALFFLLLKLVVQHVNASLDGIDMQSELFGLRALRTHVVARHHDALFDLLTFGFLVLEESHLLVARRSLLFLLGFFGLFLALSAFGTLFLGSLLLCFGFLGLLLFSLSGSRLLRFLLALLHVCLELLWVLFHLSLERVDVL